MWSSAGRSSSAGYSLAGRASSPRAGENRLAWATWPSGPTSAVNAPGPRERTSMKLPGRGPPGGGFAAVSRSSSWPTRKARRATSVTSTTTTQTSASSTICSKMSRRRRDQDSTPLRPWFEDIPGASHGVDHRRAPRVDLLAQVGDVQLHDVGLPAEVVVPDAVQYLRLRQDPSRVAHQVPQQLELGGGQLDGLAGPGDLAAVLVEGELADDQPRAGGRLGDAGAAEQRTQAQRHLLQAERLGDVVVAAGGEPGDAVLDGVLGGQEEHGEVRQVGTHPAEDLEPVDVRQHDVQDHRVGPEVTGRAHGGHAVAGAPDLQTLQP